MKSEMVSESRPDYEAEYNRLLCEKEKLCAEIDCMREMMRAEQKELEALRAKMEVVYLIFGRQ